MEDDDVELMTIAPDGIAQALLILNLDNSHLGSGGLEMLSRVNAECDKFLAASREKGEQRTSRENADAYLIAVFKLWIEQMMGPVM